jgi:excisionase family DNA binding protein
VPGKSERAESTSEPTRFVGVRTFAEADEGLRLTSEDQIKVVDSMKLLNVKEAAAFLSISKSKMYALKESRKIAYYPVDGCVRFDEQDLLAFLAAVRVEPRQKRKVGQRRDLRDAIKSSR